MSLFKSVKRWLCSHRKIKVAAGNRLTIANKKAFKRLAVSIKGTDNIVEIGRIHGHNNKLTILVNGSHNLVKIGEQEFFNADISVGLKDLAIENCSVKIGAGHGSVGSSFVLCEDDSHITIGEGGIISSHVQIWCTDTHSMLDTDGNLLNAGKEVRIGNHVWIGRDVHICKNTSIADNSIIGWNSVVTGHYHEPNVVLAGAPAKEVKHNVNWDARRPKEYLAAQKNELTTQG